MTITNGNLCFLVEQFTLFKQKLPRKKMGGGGAFLVGFLLGLRTRARKQNYWTTSFQSQGGWNTAFQRQALMSLLTMKKVPDKRHVKLFFQLHNRNIHGYRSDYNRKWPNWSWELVKRQVIYEMMHLKNTTILRLQICCKTLISWSWLFIFNSNY